MNLLFDLGHVLVDIDPKRSLQAFAQLLDKNKQDSRQAASSLITADALLGGHDSKLIDLYQVGQITTDQFLSTALQVCRPDTTKEQLLDAWFAMLLPFRPDKALLLRQLHQAGIPFYILSNINDTHAAWVRHNCPELSLAAAQFFSNEIHIAKPAPEAFQYVIDHTGINPSDTLYIDDLTPNLEVGRRFGFRCLQAATDSAWMPVVQEIIEKGRK